MNPLTIGLIALFVVMFVINKVTKKPKS